MTTLNEADVEQIALDWLNQIGWTVTYGPDIAPDTPGGERSDYGQVVLDGRLRDALAERNPYLSAPALDDALREILLPKIMSGDVRVGDVTGI